MVRVRSVVVLALLAAACASPEGDRSAAPADVNSRPAQGVVTITSDAAFGVFTPAQVTVAPGGTVRFVNATEFPHNVVFDDERMVDSSLFAPAEVFAATFSVEGSFRYVCSIHPGMAGTVTVAD